MPLERLSFVKTLVELENFRANILYHNSSTFKNFIVYVFILCFNIWLVFLYLRRHDGRSAMPIDPNDSMTGQ